MWFLVVCGGTGTALSETIWFSLVDMYLFFFKNIAFSTYMYEMSLYTNHYIDKRIILFIPIHATG